jgi:hypothetical protein
MSVSDVRTLIGAAVKKHRLVFDYWGKPIGCDCSLEEDMSEAEHAKHFTGVLMSLPGITIHLTSNE